MMGCKYLTILYTIVLSDHPLIGRLVISILYFFFLNHINVFTGYKGKEGRVAYYPPLTHQHQAWRKKNKKRRKRKRGERMRKREEEDSQIFTSELQPQPLPTGVLLPWFPLPVSGQ